MTKKTKEISCVFCGRTEEMTELKTIVGNGMGTSVCEDCAREIIAIYDQIRKQKGLPIPQNKETAANTTEDVSITDIPKPKEIKEYIDQYVIGRGRRKTHIVCGGLQSL